MKLDKKILIVGITTAVLIATVGVVLFGRVKEKMEYVHAEIDNFTVEWFGHASFLIKGEEKVIYFDPFILPSDPEKADLILITHDHFDHCDPENVNRLRKPDTTIVTTVDCATKLSGEIITVNPGDSLTVKGFEINAVHAYNINKTYHQRGKGIGFVLSLNDKRMYHAGDTDLIPEMDELKNETEIALLPIGGNYTMNESEAVEAALIINPKLVIPMHYNHIEGTEADANFFEELLHERNPSIRVKKMWEHWGRWDLTVGNIVFFSIFLLTGLTPFKRRRERYSAGMFMAFIITLFTEMYGFPLTIYIITWLFGRVPGTYEEGHLLGLPGATFGSILFFAGLFLIIVSWTKIYRGRGKFVTTGTYKYVRHPQYLGILLLTLGMIIHWFAFISFIMWLTLIFLYYRLAKKEEKEMEKKFRKKYRKYKREVPMFMPFPRKFIFDTFD